MTLPDTAPIHTEEDLVRFWNGPEFRHICENLARARGAERREAEDIAQALMVDLLKAIKDGRRFLTPPAYANKVVSHLRPRVRRSSDRFGVTGGIQVDVATEDPGPER